VSCEYSKEESTKLFDAVAAAAKEAIREALIRHKKLGNSIATSINGQIVWIPPEEIEIPEPGPGSNSAARITAPSSTALPETK
jgi:hypothetical protein